MQLYRNSNGQVITLNPNSPMGEGGEAQVFILPQDATLLAKVYRKPTNAHAAKLIAMLNNPPIDPMAAHGHISIAWPVDLLRTVNNDRSIVGFIMPCVTGMHRISDFYNPKARRQLCPVFNYYYLHHTAYNLAVAVRALHDCGYVICDLNESNVLVSDTALVTLIDTDSFQVRDPYTGVVYRGPVATSAFTPPELQGKTFSQIDRTAEHDLFALGVLIFQLLMEGTHPFTGVFQGSGEVPSYEKRILSGHFPYSIKKRVPYQPTRNAPPFGLLHPSLQRLFVNCFEDGHDDPQARPDAQAWQNALTEAESTLVTCSANNQHQYGNHLRSCPWCERTTQLNGHDPFLALQTVPHQKNLPSTQTPLPSAWTLLPPKQISRLLAYFRQPYKAFRLLIIALLAMALPFGLHYGYKRWFDPSIYIKEGDIFYEKGDFNQAIASYNKAIEIDPESAEAYFYRGRAYKKKDELKKAEDDFTQAIKLKSSFADAYRERGMLNYTKGKCCSQNALNDFTKAIDLNQDLESYYYRGDIRLAEGTISLRIAIEDFSDAIKIKPDFVEAYRKRAEAYTKQGDYDHAIADYGTLIKLRPNDLDAYKNRGILYYNNNKRDMSDLAIKDFDQAIKMGIKDSRIYLYRGKTLIKQHQLPEALENLNKVLSLKKDLDEPSQADAYFSRGEIYEELADAQVSREEKNEGKKKYDEAIADYTSAIELQPSSIIEIYKKRAMLYEKIERYKAALLDYTQISKLKPDDIDNFRKCAQLCESLSQFEDAVKFYTKIIETNPENDAEAYCRRSICYMSKRQKDISRADEDLQKADHSSDCFREANELRQRLEKKPPSFDQ